MAPTRGDPEPFATVVTQITCILFCYHPSGGGGRQASRLCHFAAGLHPRHGAPDLYGVYRPPRPRWWPLLAYVGVGSVYLVAMLGSMQQSNNSPAQAVQPPQSAALPAGTPQTFPVAQIAGTGAPTVMLATAGEGAPSPTVRPEAARLKSQRTVLRQRRKLTWPTPRLRRSMLSGSSAPNRRSGKWGGRLIIEKPRAVGATIDIPGDAMDTAAIPVAAAGRSTILGGSSGFVTGCGPFAQSGRSLRVA
jgi:hypothetical protein